MTQLQDAGNDVLQLMQDTCNCIMLYALKRDAPGKMS